MIQSFLDGGDEAHFDYSKVDNDESLDDLDAAGRDEEDRYFDEEEADGDEQSNSNGQDMEYDY